MTDTPVPDHLVDEDGLPVPDPDFDEKRKAQVMAYFAGETDEEPVLHATDPGWFRDLSARIPGLLVTSAGGICPFQSEGTIHGYPYYFRYRSGWVQLRVMDPNVDEDEATLFEHLYSAGMEYGGPYDGSLTREEFVDLMITLVPQLERGPFLWDFAGFKVNVERVPADPDALAASESAVVNAEQVEQPEQATEPGELRFTETDEPEVYSAWGHTPAEAYARLAEPSEWLVEKGWSIEAQAENFHAKRIDPNPINEDTRVFPDPEPFFEVRS